MPCSICGGKEYEAEPHETNQHTEEWVNLSDARYTGDLIFMPSKLIVAALAATVPEGIDIAQNRYGHVDRRIVKAIVDILRENEPYGDPSVGIWEDFDQIDTLEQLVKLLEDNPIRGIA